MNEQEFERFMSVINFLKQRAGLCTQDYVFQKIRHLMDEHTEDKLYYCHPCGREHYCTYCKHPEKK